MINFTPRFITFFVCNDIPETDDFDQAFSRRPPGATKG
jgi:phage/plasmid-associated DNA primase